MVNESPNKDEIKKRAANLKPVEMHVPSISQAFGNAGVEVPTPIDKDSLIGKGIVITGCRFNDGDFGEYASVDFIDTDGVKKSFDTGASYIMDKLRVADSRGIFPFKAIVSKSGRHYNID